MTWIATSEECREMDRLAQADGVTVEELMQRAGAAVADQLPKAFPSARRIAIIAGKGNNGGDGLVAARLLAQRGFSVAVFATEPVEAMNDEAKREWGRLAESGLRTEGWAPEALAQFNPDAIIDAILGTGLSGVPTGKAAEAIEGIGRFGTPVLAVDVPSGVDGDSGLAPGPAILADWTVTFGLPKPFLFQGEGAERAGRWILDPIGFPAAILQQPRTAAVFGKEDASLLMPMRRLDAHKGSEGRLLIVAGSRDMPGAAVMAARGALRAGAGLVTVASVASVCEQVAAHLPEAILWPLPEVKGGLGPDAAEAVQEGLDRFEAAVFGPGLGSTSELPAILERVFASWNLPSVVDADALNQVAKGVPPPPGPAVLTPHPGEAARLLGGEFLSRTRFETVRELAAKFGKTALLKGRYTLVGEDRQPTMVNPTGNPGMASAGMGDVLAGVIGALLAKGLEPFDAARLGAFWHGTAGDHCQREIGPSGFLASEVADRLPEARATITAR